MGQLAGGIENTDNSTKKVRTVYENICRCQMQPQFPVVNKEVGLSGRFLLPSPCLSSCWWGRLPLHPSKIRSLLEYASEATTFLYCSIFVLQFRNWEDLGSLGKPQL